MLADRKNSPRRSAAVQKKSRFASIESETDMHKRPLMADRVSPKRNYRGWTREFMELRQEEVKKRREQWDKAVSNHRELWLQRWDLIKQVRNDEISKKTKEL